MKIRFLGLITHVDLNGKDFAVLLADPSHAPLMYVRNGDVDGYSGDDEDLVNCDQLSGVISFTNLPSGRVTRGGLAGVPSLRDIAGINSTPHPHVHSQTAGGFFQAFVMLTGGYYGIEDWFREGGNFGAVRIDCVPRTVVFTVVPTAATVDVLGLGRALKLKANATITIGNLPKVTSAPQHFPAYGAFFQPSVALSGPVTMTTVCPLGTPYPSLPQCADGGKQNVGVECANTTFP